MGTRSLTCIVKDGEYKATKYCQWDGYPEGQGYSIVRFLIDDYEPEVFLSRLNQVVHLTNEQLKERWDSQAPGEYFYDKNPHLSRDMTAGEYLLYIQSTENPETVSDGVTFAADSLFCEWCYVIDLDSNKLEVYRGFNKEPLDSSERFAFLEVKEKNYYQVKFLKDFDIDGSLEENWARWTESLEDE